MSPLPGKGIWFHKTDMFKNWMKEKGYTWPARIIDQEVMIAEFNREGLERAGKEVPMLKNNWRVRYDLVQDGSGGLSTIFVTDETGRTICQRSVQGQLPAQDIINFKFLAACPTMARKLQDTVDWLGREVKNRGDRPVDDTCEMQMFRPDLAYPHLIGKLEELREDLAETLRRIKEG